MLFGILALINGVAVTVMAREPGGRRSGFIRGYAIRSGRRVRQRFPGGIRGG